MRVGRGGISSAGVGGAGRLAGLRVLRYPAAGWNVLRLFLGLVLLAAAGLKAHQLATQPVAATSPFTSRWFRISVVEFEFFFGLWLLCGLYARRTWRVALVCFSAFACVSLYKTLSGESSCGCFGAVPVKPWYTLIFDGAAVACLVSCRPPNHAETSRLTVARKKPPVSVGLATGAWLLAAFGMAGIASAFLMAGYQGSALDESGDIFGDSEFVVLEPETWVGKRLPLLRYIDIGPGLAEGDWIVVLYRPNCPSCQEVVPEYERLARRLASRGAKRQVALIEVSSGCGPVVAEYHNGAAPCARGRLDARKKWFVDVPVALVLSDGTVRSVEKGSAAWRNRQKR